MISINFDGVKNLEATLEKYADEVDKKSDELCEGMCEWGRQEAEERFHYAHYSGTNDVKLYKEPIKDGHSLVAEGTSVLFIEYGTGINTAPHKVPKYDRGSYGKHKGLNDAWVYVGETGDRGIELGNGRVLTYGDPANECMYNASVEMRDNIGNVARGVFKK